MSRETIKPGWTYLCVLVFVLAACGSEQQVSAPSSTPPNAADKRAESINWFEGSVQEALTYAEDQGQPLFLYWGAVWCPPCNLIKSTVFIDPSFISQSRQFVAVYLDGDQEAAQRWGEHFGTMGYPTLIVLSSQAEELLRLGAGQPPAEYQKALAQVSQSSQAIPALLAAALENAPSLQVADWRRLARYAWDLDQDGRILGNRKPADVFLRLKQHCPEPSLQTRFSLLAALSGLRDAEKLDAQVLNLLEHILDSPELARANLLELQYDGANLIAAVAAADSVLRERVIAKYQQLMQTAWDDKSLPLKLRFAGHYGLLDLQQSEPAGMAKFAEVLEQRVVWLQQQSLSPQQAQSMIPGAAWLLHKAGKSERAREILELYLNNAIAPYYSMSYLASIEQDLGNISEALRWSDKARMQATGPATRIQWSLSHLNRLVSLAPEQKQQVADVLSDVFQQLHAHPQSFYQRTRVRLQRSLELLTAWAKWPEHQAALRSSGPIVTEVCGALAQDHPSRGVCEAYRQLTQAASDRDA